MVDAPVPGHLHGSVLGAVVDNQGFDGINAFNVLWQMIQRHSQRFRLIVAGNLDDQLHWQRPFVSS